MRAYNVFHFSLSLSVCDLVSCIACWYVIMLQKKGIPAKVVSRRPKRRPGPAPLPSHLPASTWVRAVQGLERRSMVSDG